MLRDLLPPVAVPGLEGRNIRWHRTESVRFVCLKLAMRTRLPTLDLPRLCRAVHQADRLLVTDVYPASETPIPGIDAETLAAAITERGHREAVYVGDLGAATERLAKEVRKGDVVLTLGAGNVWTAGEELLRRRGS